MVQVMSFESFAVVVCRVHYYFVKPLKLFDYRFVFLIFFVIHFRFDIYVQSKILSSDAISIPTVLICHLQTKQPNTEREMSYFLINSEYLQASNYLVNL